MECRQTRAGGGSRTICRPRNLLALLAAALVLSSGLIFYRAMSARPGPLTDYSDRLYELSLSVQGPGDNQWATYQDVLSFLRDLENGAGSYEEYTHIADPSGAASRAQWEELQSRGRALIESHRANGLFEATSRLPTARPASRPPEGQMWSSGPSQLSDARRLSRVLVARMHMSAEQNEWNDYVKAVEEGLAIARILAAQGALLDYLTGIAVEAFVLGEMRADVAEGLIEDEAALDALLLAMERQRKPSGTCVMEGARLMALDVVQRIYTDDGKGNGRLIVSRLPELGLRTPLPSCVAGYSIVNVASALFPDRSQITKEVNRLCDALVADMSVPAYERSEAPDAEALLAAMPDVSLLSQLLWSASRVPTLSDRFSTMEAGTRLLLRLERYKLREQAPVKSLARLPIEDPDAQIVDPMTGQPFGYVLAPESPAGYVLFAAGADGQLDGGVMADQGNERAFLDDQRGVDFIFNTLPDVYKWDER